jgi:hypothetical protein
VEEQVVVVRRVVTMTGDDGQAAVMAASCNAEVPLNRLVEHFNN